MENTAYLKCHDLNKRADCKYEAYSRNSEWQSEEYVAKMQQCRLIAAVQSCPSGAACFRLGASRWGRNMEGCDISMHMGTPPPPPTSVPPLSIYPFRGLFNEELARWCVWDWKTHSWRKNGNGWEKQDTSKQCVPEGMVGPYIWQSYK